MPMERGAWRRSVTLIAGVAAYICSAEAGKLWHSEGLRAETSRIPVDFYVFLGRDDNKSGVAPSASMNIGGTDNETGFYVLCKDFCPTYEEQGDGWTAPQMRYCSCVAELMVKDLNADFGELVDHGSPFFELGDYVELDLGQELFNIPDGHSALSSLLMTLPSDPHYRRPGRLTVWIANQIDSSNAGHELAGTTMLDQPLYADSPGAGVLLQAGVARREKRLSHEVGHVVGFHHVAGPPVNYTYEHAACPEESRRVEWEMQSRPSCEMNIMGGWYDGPYCCPFPDEVEALQVGWETSHSSGAAGRRSYQFKLRGGPTCLPNNLSSPKSPFCCGEGCTHRCPDDTPPLTFATEQHKQALSSIFLCWLQLSNTESPPVPRVVSFATASVAGSHMLICNDYPAALGPCMAYTPHQQV